MGSGGMAGKGGHLGKDRDAVGTHHSRRENGEVAGGRKLSRDDAFLLAHSLWLERAAGDAVERLAAAGIPAILLKGPLIASWLYDGEVRPYRDIDLLVPPAEFPRAVRVLTEAGYVDRLEGADACEFGFNEKELYGANGVCIDLHHRLIGLSEPPDRCWQVLARRTTPFRLASGSQVSVLDLGARAMHLALHAAQDGPLGKKAIADLERGLARVPHDDWRAAAELAEDLGGALAFSAGLRLVPAGRLLAANLQLPTSLTVELALRTQSARPDSIFFQRLGEAHGVKRKAALVWRKLVPTAAYLRANHSVAGRGRVGLLLAEVERVASVLRRAGPALLSWHRGRSEARRSHHRPGGGGLER